MADQPQIKPSNFQYDKKDPTQQYTLAINGVAGLNNAMPFNQIEDNEFQQIYNVLPIAPFQVRKLKSPTLIATLPNKIVFFINDVINGSLIKFAVLADGSCGTISGSTYTQVSGAGTFSGVAANIDYVNWINQQFLIIDINGYFAFNGTTLTTLPSGISAIAVNAGGSGYAVGDTFTVNNSVSGATLATCSVSSVSSGAVTGITITDSGTLYSISTGAATKATTGTGSGLTVNITALTTLTGNTTIAVWQSRVFTAQGRTLNYSVAGSYADFTSSGSGYLQPSTSDMKMQIMKIVPYMDSVYLVCDHSILSLTGTTISNDPNNWYLMEVFNSLGTLNKFSVIDYNNTIYLKNEYGIWLVSSTQSEKLDYKLDSTLLTYPNLPATLAQINNLNFYMQIINGFSQVKGSLNNMILAYCVDLGQFYFLDFGFNIEGLYTTVSITDHTIYVWDDQNNLYSLLTGSNPVSVYMQSKYYDFNFDFIYKTILEIGTSLVLKSGTAQLQISGMAQSGKGFSSSQQQTQQLSSPDLILLYSPSYPTIPIALTNSFNQAIGLSSMIESLLTAIYYIGVGGILVSFVFSENSNAVYDIINIYIKGQIGHPII